MCRTYWADFLPAVPRSPYHSVCWTLWAWAPTADSFKRVFCCICERARVREWLLVPAADATPTLRNEDYLPARAMGWDGVGWLLGWFHVTLRLKNPSLGRDSVLSWELAWKMTRWQIPTSVSASIVVDIEPDTCSQTLWHMPDEVFWGHTFCNPCWQSTWLITGKPSAPFDSHESAAQCVVMYSMWGKLFCHWTWKCNHKP